MQNPNQMISKTMIFDEVALSLQKAVACLRRRFSEKVEVYL